MNKVFIVLGLISLLALTACVEQSVNNNFKDPIKLTLSYRNKTENCTYNYPYQDFGCSPGHTFPLTAIKVNGVYAKEPGTAYVGDICESGYTANVRDVPDKLKKQVYFEYKIYTHKAYEYEIDHIISLELGGDNDISNLYPQPKTPYPGYKDKDKIENMLHKKVR
jgi:hypothetical protein